eukprot:COSAG01_NODE_6614_length_3581_cov_1.071018_7_plen_152_part_00
MIMIMIMIIMIIIIIIIKPCEEPAPWHAHSHRHQRVMHRGRLGEERRPPRERAGAQNEGAGRGQELEVCSRRTTVEDLRAVPSLQVPDDRMLVHCGIGNDPHMLPVPCLQNIRKKYGGRICGIIAWQSISASSARGECRTYRLGVSVSSIC